LLDRLEALEQKVEGLVSVPPSLAAQEPQTYLPDTQPVQGADGGQEAKEDSPKALRLLEQQVAEMQQQADQQVVVYKQTLQDLKTLQQQFQEQQTQHQVGTQQQFNLEQQLAALKQKAEQQQQQQQHQQEQCGKWRELLPSDVQHQLQQWPQQQQQLEDAQSRLESSLLEMQRQQQQDRAVLQDQAQHAALLQQPVEGGQGVRAHLQPHAAEVGHTDAQWQEEQQQQQKQQQQQRSTGKSCNVDYSRPCEERSPRHNKQKRVTVLMPIVEPQSEARDSEHISQRCPSQAPTTNVKAWLAMLAKYPSLTLVPVCVFIIITALCLFGVMHATNIEAQVQRDLAEKAAQETADRMSSCFARLSEAARMLATHVYRSPDWATLEAVFNVVAVEIFRQHPSFPISLSELVLMPFGEVSASWSFPNVKQGSNSLLEDVQQEDTFRAIRTRSTQYIGPPRELDMTSDSPFICARFPVFIPDVDEDEDWGNPNGMAQFAGCPPGLCYNATTREKFWGFAAALYSTGSLAQGTDVLLAAIQKKDLRFMLIMERPDGHTSVIESDDPIDLDDAIAVPLSIPGLHWELRVNEERGWQPHYREGLIALVVVGTFILAVLVLLLMASMKRGSLLLQDQMCTNRWLEHAMANLEDEKLQRETLLGRQFDLIACLEQEREHERESANASSSQIVDASAMGRIASIRNAISDNNNAKNHSQELEVLELLGEGTFGKVHKGLWRGTVVAIKTMLLPANMSGQEKRERMAIMEAAISSSLAHPNVVQTYTYSIKPIIDRMHGSFQDGSTHASAVIVSPGSWVNDGKVDVSDEGCADDVLAAIKRGKDCLHSYEVRLVIEHCDRGCLRTALDEEVFLSNTGLNYAAILDSASDIARAMLHLHCNDVVHADLKAQNVMLCSSGAEGRGVTCKIADFGLAVRMEDTTTHMSGLFQGTLTHMAPEILLEGRVSKAADVYAFGITCWELFTSGKPFHGVAKALLGHVIAREHRRPTFPNLTPGGFRGLIERCWAHNPEDRPTFHQIVEELKGLRSAVPGPTPPVHPEDCFDKSHVNKLGSSAVPFGQKSQTFTKSLTNPLAFADAFSPPESPHVAINISHGGSSFFEEVEEEVGVPQQASCTGGTGRAVRDSANIWSPTNNNRARVRTANDDWSPINKSARVHFADNSWSPNNKNSNNNNSSSSSSLCRSKVQPTAAI